LANTIWPDRPSGEGCRDAPPPAPLPPGPPPSGAASEADVPQQTARSTDRPCHLIKTPPRTLFPAVPPAEPTLQARTFSRVRLVSPQPPAPKRNFRRMRWVGNGLSGCPLCDYRVNPAVPYGRRATTHTGAIPRGCGKAQSVGRPIPVTEHPRRSTGSRRAVRTHGGLFRGAT
jgi:hypothetical protein